MSKIIPLVEFAVKSARYAELIKHKRVASLAISQNNYDFLRDELRNMAMKVDCECDGCKTYRGEMGHGYMEYRGVIITPNAHVPDDKAAYLSIDGDVLGIVVLSVENSINVPEGETIH